MKEKKGRERTKGERMFDNKTRREETDRRQMSIVKMVVAELKMEVCDDISAAIITANIKPRAP